MKRFFYSALMLTISATAMADNWTGGEGSYNDDTNWSSGDVPGSADEAVINNGGTVSIDSFVDASKLRIGTTNGTSGTLLDSRNNL